MTYEHPGTAHERTSALEKVRPGPYLAFTCGLLAVAMVIVDEAAPTTNPGYEASGAPRIVWAIFAVSAAVAIGFVPLDWYFRRLQRRLRRLCNASEPVSDWHPPARRAGADQVRVDFRRPPAASGSYRRVTTRSNVVGAPPLHITYFRCFANPARTRTFLEGAWSEFGYAHLLRHPESTTWRELWRLRRPEVMAELVVSTEAQLRDRLRRSPAEPVRRRPYGEYPVREFFCSDAFWQRAAGTLIEMADLVVIDLSGLTPAALGLRFELERAFATKRPDQVVVLADELSDRGYLAAQIRQAWPGGPAEVLVHVLDSVVSRDVTHVGPDGIPITVVNTQLYSDRSESRQLLRSVLLDLAP
ncbi:hypothetical protein [Lentzea sp.]|uniref:hypothetical protein n=1 Tax=Lentzea sp. TaxID=56099 RepID=UPI002CDDE26F|nr:hypothetical protein [Lentzea sp.]HUQ59616.1 hypothetical protein [Lentzea sp.]